jgi:competence protein ComEC
MHRHHKKIIDVASAIVILSLIILNAKLWKTILDSTNHADITPGIYFFPVTQGESALLALPGGVTALTDAGSDGGIVEDLQKISSADIPSYIDLAVISSPQADDYTGYYYLLQHYRVGAFIYNGRADNTQTTEWQQLMASIATKQIPLITLTAGDRISYGDTAKIDILSPDASFSHSPDPSDTGLVQRITMPTLSVLLAADIGANTENALLGTAGSTHPNLVADILKAPFPGLGTPAGDEFLQAVAPKIIVIEPGAKGEVSQPTKATLARLASSTNATITSPKHGSFLLYNK